MSGLFLNIRLSHKINHHNYRWRLQAVPPPPDGQITVMSGCGVASGRTFPVLSNGCAISDPDHSPAGEIKVLPAGMKGALMIDRRRTCHRRSKAVRDFSGRNCKNRKDDMQDVKFSGKRVVPSRRDRSAGWGRVSTMECAGTHADIVSQHCRAPVFQQPGHRETAFAKVIGK